MLSPLTRVPWWLARIALSLLSTVAQAQPVHAAQCAGSRVGCETAILQRCPQGATLLGEQLLPAGAPSASRYSLEYRCGTKHLGSSALHADWVRRKREERRGYRLGPPLAVLFTGVAMTSLLVLPTLLHGDDQRGAKLGVLLGGWGVLTGGVTLVGIVWLTKVVRKRRAVDRELEHYAERPLRPLLALAPVRQGASANLTLRF